MLLDFRINCPYITNGQTYCLPKVSFVATGLEARSSVQTVLPVESASDRTWQVLLGTKEATGSVIQYHLEMTDLDGKVRVRYPARGELAITIVDGFDSGFVPVPKEGANGQPEIVQPFAWGDQPGQIGQDLPADVVRGPFAFDVAPDGRMAILDSAHASVWQFAQGSKEPEVSSVVGLDVADIEYSDNGSLFLLAQPGSSSSAGVAVRAQLHQIISPGEPPRYVGELDNTIVFGLVDGGKNVFTQQGVLTALADNYAILAPSNQSMSSRGSDLLVQWIDPSRTRLYDPATKVAVELTAEKELGSVLAFARTQDGYCLVYEWSTISVVRLDRSGHVVSVSSTPDQQYTPFNPYGRVAILPDGSVYVIQSAETGVSIERFASR